MIKIAVVDDDSAILQKLKELLSSFDVRYGYDLKTDFFCSCEELADTAAADVFYDLIFLDIEFSGMNGTEFASMLRHKMKNYDTQIIFISSVKEHALELFRIAPVEFLVKPITEKEFMRCMLMFMDIYRKNENFLEYTQENTKHRIRSREVLYIESSGKKAVFHTKNGVFSVYGKVSEIIKHDSSRFICVSRGIYVNTDHIIGVTLNELHLTDETVLSISRGCRSAVRDRLGGL
jgi:DNA-binding LytR/AlgR family response regulator